MSYEEGVEDTQRMRSMLWVFMTMGCALLFLGGGCGRSTTASSRDAALDVPAGTGGTASGGIVGTGGGAASSPGQDGGPASTGGTASGSAGGSSGAGTGGAAGGGDSSIGGARTGGIGGGGGTSRTGMGGGGAGAGGTAAGGSGGIRGPLCPGVAPPPSGFSLCRTLSDCPSGNNYCMASGPTFDDGCAGQLAYVMPAGPQECKLDTDCGTGRICVGDGWCVGGGTVCAAGCTATSCQAGATCKSGWCVMDGTGWCTEGYTCPSGTTCSSGTYQDEHGCVAVSCTAGYTCPSGSTCDLSAVNRDLHDCNGTLCQAGYPCPAGRTCAPTPYADGTDSHGCVLASCDGYVCPKNQVCQVDARGVYCARKSCTSDGDCDCGACLKLQGASSGQCYSRLGICAYWSARGTGGSTGTAQGGGGAGVGGITGSGGIGIDGG
jgi:hypothetical protein